MNTLLIWDISVCVLFLCAMFGLGYALGGAVEAARIRRKLITRRLTMPHR